ncbi:ABC transporter permease [soil metagenome]
MSVAEPTVGTAPEPVLLAAAGQVRPAADRPPRGRSVTSTLLHSPSFVIGSVIVGFWVVCAVLGAHITPHDPFADDPLSTLLPPSSEHWLGTDQIGRDIASRVMLGARSILTVAPLATLIGTALGTFIGLLTGYRRGWVEAVLTRVVEAVMALPVVVVALVALVALGPSTTTVILVIGLVFTMPVARTVHTAVVAESELDYVAAAQLRRESTLRIMFAEILPNVLPSVLIEATVRLGYAIFFIATLSFIGFGIQPPSPDWGLTIFENYALLRVAMWAVLGPAVAIASLVVGVNLISDGASQALDQ